MQATSTQTVETDRELKAYIYQQLVELQPYLIPDSQMAVSVHQVAGMIDDMERNVESDRETDPELASELGLGDEYEVEVLAAGSDDDQEDDQDDNQTDAGDEDDSDEDSDIFVAAYD